MKILNKLKIVIMSIMILFTTFTNSSVEAGGVLTLEPTGYISHTISGMTGNTRNWEISKLNLQGRYVFCIESGVLTDTGNVYTSEPYTAEERHTLSKIAYYGYTTTSKSDYDYVVTQLMIWEHLGDKLISTDIPNYQGRKAEIMSLINKHDVVPSWSEQTHIVEAGSTLTISDTNKVLKDMHIVSNTTGAVVSIDGNSLVVKADSNSVDGVITLQKFPQSDIGTPIVYKSPGKQTLAEFNLEANVSASINIDVEHFGDIEVTKIDEDSGEPIKGTVIGFEHNGVKELVETDTNGTASLTHIKEDTKVIITEEVASDGYYNNGNQREVIIEGNKVIDILLTNKVQQGQLNIIKTGSTAVNFTTEETDYGVKHTLVHDYRTKYVAYFSITNIVDELDFPSSEIFYYQQQQFNFPIDTSMKIEIVENKKALTTIRNKKKELNDLDNHAFESNNDTANSVMFALDNVNELESTLEQTKEAMYKFSYLIRVSANTLEELKKRCDEVKDFYDDFSIKIIRPFGDMLGFHQEFIPTSKRHINDYVQYVTGDFISSLGFGATQMLGEANGIYVGYNVDTGKNVYLQPSLASQGVKGSMTNALASAFIGSLGGGKSFANNLLIYYAVLFGGQALIVDPKGERGNWKRDLPEIAHEINIVNLTSCSKNQGLLDPYVILDDLKTSESLAIDVLTFLTGISSRDSKKFPVLRKAIRNVTLSHKRGLLCVIDELRKEATPTSLAIAEHIDSFTDYDFAHLLFSDGSVKDSISLDKRLNIIQVADLVLPDSDTSLEEYTTLELLSIAMLLVISTFSLDFIYLDRSIFKIVDLDEAWSFLQVAQGKALSMKLVRAGRAMNAGVYFVTQNTDDLLDEKLKNNIGLKFAFRSTDINEIKKTLRFFGVDEEDEYNRKRLKNLENGQCLLSDIYGRVGVVQFHPVFEELFNAFDTRPPIRKESHNETIQ